MNKIDIFEQYLEYEDFPMEKSYKNDYVVFDTPIEAEGGLTVHAFITFEEDYVVVELFNIVEMVDLTKKHQYLEVLNRVNDSTYFSKFVLDDKNYIQATSAFFTPKKFTLECAENIMTILSILVSTTEKVYPDLMKIQWG